MGKVCFLLLVLFLASCSPAPTMVKDVPTPDLVDERHGNLTLVEFFGIT